MILEKSIYLDYYVFVVACTFCMIFAKPLVEGNHGVRQFNA